MSEIQQNEELNASINRGQNDAKSERGRFV